MKKNEKHDSNIGMSLSLSQFLYFWGKSNFKVSKERRGKFFDHLFYLLFNSGITSVLTAMEKIKYAKKIKETRLTSPPVFILGHWRSGTTFFHNMMSKDPAFAYLKMLHAMTYPFCNIAENSDSIKEEISSKTAAVRPMDQVSLGLDEAFEDEYPVMYSYNSGYLGWIFPGAFKKFYDKYLFFDNQSRQALKWKKTFYKVIKKLTFLYEGKQLLLKNPINTVRVKLILDLFPDAKFIYIKRDPYKVFLSTLRLNRDMTEESGMQVLPDEVNRECVLDYYVKLLNQYHTDKHLIPEGNLTEVCYENFAADPIGQLKNIYSALGLTGYDEALPHFKTYQASLAGYKTADYEEDQKLKAELREKWHMGYEDWEKSKM